MYHEIMSEKPRTYRKVERARREAETRLKITRAAVDLHETRGPANTTVTDIARMAGVSRMTVYNHFPNDVDLFAACSSHWATRNPFPDASSWDGIDDPRKRLTAGLEELYGWYGEKQEMLGMVFRDLPLVPALAEVMTEFWSSYVDAIVATLARGWRASPTGLDAALRLAVDFNTWRSLSASGLDDPAAARLVARMVTGVTESSRSVRHAET